MEQRINGEKRFALVIDADNVSAKYVNVILDELSKYGTVTYKRIYGDWTSTLHSKWKNTLLDNSITPIQQFSYTQGKNATDHAMIIDAMDILYTGQVDGFCIVSSDSDFTRLAARIRESGLTVIGMGEKKTPLAFRKACDIFTTLELLMNEVPTQKDHVPGKSGRATDAPAPAISKERIEEAVISIVTYNQNNGKDTGLGEVGSRLQKRYPDFDVRNYGTNQLRKLLESFESITVTKEGNTLSVGFAEGYEPPAADAASDESKAEDAFNEKMADAASTGEGAAAVSESAEVAEDAEEAPKKKTRRGKRGGRKNKAAAEDEQVAAEGEVEASAEADAQAEPETDEKTTKSHRGARRRSSKINATTDDTETTKESADETPSEDSERKPAAEAETKGESADEPAPVKRRPPRRPPVRRTFSQVAQENAAQAEKAAESEKVADAPAPEAEAAAEEKPKSKRGNRSKKSKTTKSAAKTKETTEEVAVVVESNDDAIVFSWPPSDEVVAALDEQKSSEAQAEEEKPKRKRSTRSKKAAAEEAAPVEEAAATEDEPKRKRSTRSKKAAAAKAIGAEATPAVESVAEVPAAEDAPAAEEKPKRKRASRSKKAAAAKAADPAPAAEPAPEQSAKPAPDVEAVRAYVRTQLESNPDIAPAALGKKVHSKFRGFKLSDHGFRTFKDFLKTV